MPPTAVSRTTRQHVFLQSLDVLRAKKVGVVAKGRPEVTHEERRAVLASRRLDEEVRTEIWVDRVVQKI